MPVDCLQSTLCPCLFVLFIGRATPPGPCAGTQRHGTVHTQPPGPVRALRGMAPFTPSPRALCGHSEAWHRSHPAPGPWGSHPKHRSQGHSSPTPGIAPPTALLTQRGFAPWGLAQVLLPCPHPLQTTPGALQAMQLGSPSGQGWPGALWSSLLLAQCLAQGGPISAGASRRHHLTQPSHRPQTPPTDPLPHADPTRLLSEGASSRPLLTLSPAPQEWGEQKGLGGGHWLGCVGGSVMAHARPESRRAQPAPWTIKRCVSQALSALLWARAGAVTGPGQGGGTCPGTCANGARKWLKVPSPSARCSEAVPGAGSSQGRSLGRGTAYALSFLFPQGVLHPCSAPKPCPTLLLLCPHCASSHF
ncbi:unnamed protein product [Lepidochelys kempii]